VSGVPEDKVVLYPHKRAFWRVQTILPRVWWFYRHQWGSILCSSECNLVVAFRKNILPASSNLECTAFEVLTAVKIHTVFFWVVTPSCLAGTYQRCGGAYYLHHQELHIQERCPIWNGSVMWDSSATTVSRGFWHLTNTLQTLWRKEEAASFNGVNPRFLWRVYC
jgi:hypothetical protein